MKFRDIANSGRILDALVAEGANQINGPMLAIDRPEAALDEARTQALANARARAELYARALNMQVARVLAVSETGAMYPPPRPMMARNMVAQDAATEIVAGRADAQRQPDGDLRAAMKKKGRPDSGRPFPLRLRQKPQRAQ